MSPAIHRCAVQSASGGQRRAFVRACVRACLACVHACVHACVLRSVLFRIRFLGIRVSRRKLVSIRETLLDHRFVSVSFEARLFPARKLREKKNAAYVSELCVNNDSAEAQSHRLGSTEVVRRSERGSLSLSPYFFLLRFFLIYNITPFSEIFTRARPIDPVERIMDPRCGGILR